MRLNVFSVAEETVERPGGIGARLFYKNKETLDGRGSEVACNVMDGGKSRGSYVDFIPSVYLYGKSQTRRTVLATKCFIWCQISNLRIMLKVEEWNWYRFISKLLCDPLSASFHKCSMPIFNQINNFVRWTSGLNLGDFKENNVRLNVGYTRVHSGTLG